MSMHGIPPRRTGRSVCAAVTVRITARLKRDVSYDAQTLRCDARYVRLWGDGEER